MNIRSVHHSLEHTVSDGDGTAERSISGPWPPALNWTFLAGPHWRLAINRHFYISQNAGQTQLSCINGNDPVKPVVRKSEESLVSTLPGGFIILLRT